jgi:hypothetical protein
MKPLAIDIFCGLGGWTEGLLAEGYRVVGFDIERHVYGEAQYPAQLVLQDVLTIHGAQFKDAALIVASPPCQAYSYRAMPWKRAKALPPPSNELFEACFRIQREAIEAAGRYIPLVVENVCGAQKWVGRARWHYGSFYLWGDVPALMPITRRAAKVPGLNWNGSDKPGYVAQAFNTTAEQWLREPRTDGTKTPSREKWHGTSTWTTGHMEVAHNTTSGHGRNPVNDHIKNKDADGYERNHPAAFGWKKPRTSSKSSARKAASSHIAKIPLVLARWIARAWLPL